MNWPMLMALGLGALRLSPQVFWAMTPREFRAALKGAFGPQAEAMTRGAFETLQCRFPDEEP